MRIKGQNIEKKRWTRRS